MADEAPVAAGRYDGHWHVQSDSLLRHLPPKCCEGCDFTITTRWHFSSFRRSLSRSTSACHQAESLGPWPCAGLGITGAGGHPQGLVKRFFVQNRPPSPCLQPRPLDICCQKPAEAGAPAQAAAGSRSPAAEAEGGNFGIPAPAKSSTCCVGAGDPSQPWHWRQTTALAIYFQHVPALLGSHYL